jgi:hypothetical protein
MVAEGSKGGCATSSDGGIKELLPLAISDTSLDGIIKGLFSLTETLISLDGRVLASKSKTVDKSFLPSVRNEVKESTNWGSSELGSTLFFPLSYLDFRGKAISFGRES